MKNKPRTLELRYRNSNGVMQSAFACDRHLPHTLLNIQQTDAVVDASRWECDCCAFDREAEKREVAAQDPDYCICNMERAPACGVHGYRAVES